MPSAINPMPLPDTFNPETQMLARRENNRMYHAPRAAIELVANLLDHGHPDDIAQAERTLNAALKHQETRPDHPHRGNFFWEAEDAEVEDLNAVQFCLFHLIPLMIRNGSRLSEPLQQRANNAIRLGLEEIARLDVHPRYTNIVLKDIANTCLGGEYLGDETFKQRGCDKFTRWMAFTDQSGCVCEFNSPGYAGVSLRVLNRLIELVQSESIRVRADIMRARIGLSAVLHIHPATGRWAGPFSRAYRPTVFCETPPEIHTVRDWLSTGILPPWLANALVQRPQAMSLVETADARNSIATYHSASFALGVSSHELTTQSNRFIAGQSNCFIAHHTASENQTGVIYSRYVLNDRWLGSFRSTPARSSTQVLFEEGQFHGVLDGPRALCLYAPRTLGAWEPCHSAKAVITWHKREHVDGIWMDGAPVQTLPTPVAENATVVVASGQMLTAIRPLSRTDLGSNAPLHLIARDGHLCLEIHNYKGAEKTFWELAHPGSFYQGLPKCGFFAEVAERADWPDPVAFSNEIASGEIRERCDPPQTYDEGVERIWSIQYARAERKLGIEVDLMTWALKRRWNQNSDLGFPMLECPIARQSRTGHIEIADAALTCGRHPAWLFATPGAHCYAAAYHGPEPASFHLTVPGGSVSIPTLSAGLVVWDNGNVRIHALGMEGQPAITGGRRV